MTTVPITPTAHASHTHCLSLTKPVVWGMMPAWEMIGLARPWLAGECARLAYAFGGMPFKQVEARVMR